MLRSCPKTGLTILRAGISPFDANLTTPSRQSRSTGISRDSAPLALLKAQKAQTRDSSLVRDWRPGLVVFASVEDTPVRSLGVYVSSWMSECVHVCV